MLTQVVSSGWISPMNGLPTSLTHWGRNKMAAIFQTTFSKSFSSVKIVIYWLKFHWSLSLRVQSIIFQHWCRKWLGTDQVTNHYLNQWWLVYWCIYASFGLNDFIFLWETLISIHKWVWIITSTSLKGQWVKKTYAKSNVKITISDICFLP